MEREKSYSVDGIQVLSAREHIRRRPGMYVGSLDFKGVTNLIKGIFACAHEEGKILEMEIKLGPNLYEIFFDGVFPERFFDFTNWRYETTRCSHNDLICVTALPFLSKPYKFQISDTEQTKISFWPDPDIWPEIEMDMRYFQEMCFHFSLLRPHVKLRVLDERTPEHQRFFYHFPQGLSGEAYRWRKLCYNTSDWTLELKEKVGESNYDITFFLGNSLILHDRLLHFASKERLLEKGSLVLGIESGLIAAIQAFAKVKNDETIKIHRKRLLDELFLCAHVDTPYPHYSGCTKSQLDMPSVRKEIRKLVKERFVHFLENSPQIARNLLTRYSL